MFPCALFPWVLLYLRCTTHAHSSGDRSTHLLDEPGGFRDSCHQNTCVGGGIQRKNSTHTKVGEKRNAVLNVDSECLDGVQLTAEN